MVKKEEENNSGTEYEDGQYPFVLYNRLVLRHKINDKITVVFSFDYNLLNDLIVRSLL